MHMMSDIQPSGAQTPFDSIRQIDDKGNEYWSAHELGKLLGYDDFFNFRKPLNRAIKACENSGNQVVDHFLHAQEMIPIGKGATREVEGYHLTRYACYLIAQNADPAKEIVAHAQTYFAVMTYEQEALLALAREVGDNPLAETAQRIALRQELTQANKDLMKRAVAAGVITKEQAARFVNWGYKGLYAGETKDDIHVRKQLPAKEEISNWMGAIETMANFLRAVVAERRLERQGDMTATAANRTHYLAGQTVRGWLVSEGIYPEQLPTPTKSYREIVKEEAARIAEEERLEALAEEDQRGLWGQLPDSQ